MIQFYAPDIECGSCLTPEDSAHCCRVLRLHEGDSVRVVDGRGGVYRCTIMGANPRCTDLMVECKTQEPLPDFADITIAVAPTKNNDRMEWLVEKAVEMGVGRIVPVLCNHSERKVLKTERLRKIAVSAMKQSLKSWLPAIDDLVPYSVFLKLLVGTPAYMGYCDSWLERRDFAKTCRADAPACILIGPEGDFSPEEVRLALAAGVIPVTFGQTRLRTETAALYALATVHVLRDLTVQV